MEFEDQGTRLRASHWVFIVIVFALIISFALAYECTRKEEESKKPRKEIIGQTGVLGEHLLTNMAKSEGVNGSIFGQSFLSFGLINGSLSSESVVRFFWTRKQGEIVATSLPYSKFLFVIDEKKETPTVEFIFSSSWLNERIDKENRAPENINELLYSSMLELVKIRLSSSVMQDEVYNVKTYSTKPEQ